MEASILSLASSDAGAAGDQIKAVLGFSKLLREQKVVGRLAVNVLHADDSVPVYLEDKDVLNVSETTLACFGYWIGKSQHDGILCAGEAGG